MKILFTLTFIFSLLSTQTLATMCGVNCELEKELDRMNAQAESHTCCHGHNSEEKSNHGSHLCSSDLSGICSHQQFALNTHLNIAKALDPLALDASISYITLIKSLSLNHSKIMNYYLDSPLLPSSQPLYLQKEQFLI
tara:strand:+ start:14393 stop:14806 length:414 start_codon:yes stop_codon:yes gene_type:complete